MIINKDVYPDVSVGTYTTVSNPVMDYDADEPLEHSIFYAGSISENVQFCDETNYTYNATAPNCQFSITPKDIVKADVFFVSRGFRFFNFNNNWEYRNDQTYNIVTEFDVSQFYFDMNQLTCQVYELSNPDGGHAIGSATNMSFNTYRSQTAEYKKTHLIRSVTCNYVYGDSTSFCKYKGVANYYDVNVSPMIRYKFNDKTTIYAPVILNIYGLPNWQGPVNLNTLTGSGNFPEQSSDIYSAQYTMFGKWYDSFTSGSPAHMVTAANIGAIDNFTVHAGNDQGQQVNNGYHIPDITGIDTDKYMVPVFLWGNRWDKSIAPFFTDEFLMRYIASFGLRFKVGDTMYIGYMNSDGTCNGDYILESELADSDSANRNITDFSGSNYDANVPYVPPTPSGDDDMESMTTGFASTLSGCTTYYLMSPLDIVTLIRDYYQHAFAGSTMSNSIISCNLLGLNETEIFSESSLDSHTIKIPTVSRQAIFESVNSYNEISGYLNKIPVGSISVPRQNGDFHDFSPYTIYEVFIPYCGWCSLPDTVAGRTIYVEMHIDLRTMCGKGIVLVGDDDGGKATCAEMCMNFGSSIPFAVIESGLQRQAAITAGIQTAGGFAQGMSGIISGHSSLAISGIANAIQGVANGAISTCTNYTQVQGKAGDTSDFANGRQCYLKISWAKTDEVVNNSTFGHTIGYLCNEVGQLKNYHGFTVCGNPHITGIDCTEEEKEEIKRLLEQGVILPSGE